MAVNSAITAAIVANPVPPDRECVATGTEILQLVQDFSTVNVTDPAQVASDGSSIANQALNIANTALATAQETAARLPQYRFSGSKISIPQGDNPFPISWAPELPNTNYLVNLTFFANSGATGSYAWAVIDGSESTSGCTLRLNDIPNALFQVKWLITSIPAEPET